MPACSGALRPGHFRFADTHPAERAALLARALRVAIAVIGSPTSSPLRFVDGDWPAPQLLLAGFPRAETRTTKIGSVLVVDLRTEKPLPSTGLEHVPSGRNVNLELVDASAPELFDLIAGIAKVRLKDPPPGAISVFVQNRPSGDVVATLAELTGDAHFGNGTLSFGPGAKLGAAPTGRPRTICNDGEPFTLATLRCVPRDELRVAGVARAPGEGADLALLARRGDAAALVVRVGDTVGAERARVDRIECDRVVLDDGSTIALGP